MFGNESTIGAASHAPSVEVRLIRMPVALYRRAAAHRDDLIREFRLLVSSDPEAFDGLPQRFLDLYTKHDAELSSLQSVAGAAFEEALATGMPTVDLEYRVPQSVGHISRMLDTLHDAAEAQCRLGAALTLPATSVEVELRRWVFGQFADQTAGFPPTPWRGPVD